MKRKTKIFAGVASVCLLTAAFVFAGVSQARADDETDNARKQLVTCQVQQGDVIIKIGNTCSSGGQGCSPNPCE